MESLAQLGVQLLLFTLGLEFSLSKLRAVRSVALLGRLPAGETQSPAHYITLTGACAGEEQQLCCIAIRRLFCPGVMSWGRRHLDPEPNPCLRAELASESQGAWWKSSCSSSLQE